MKTFQVIDQASVVNRKASSVPGVIVGEIAANHIPLTEHAEKGALAVFAPSVRSYIDHLLAEYPEPKNEGSSDARRSGDFNTFASYDDAIDTFTNRVDEIRRFSISDADLKQSSAIGNDVQYDVVGDVLDIGRFLDGEPECWAQMTNGNPRSIVADIAVNATAVWSVNESALRKRAQRILRLVDWLESRGIRTSITAFEISQCNYTEVLVKDAGDHIDLDGLAVVTHPEFLRRLIFRQIEWSNTYSSGYGTAMSHRDGYLRFTNRAPSGISILTEYIKDEGRVDAAWDKMEAEIVDRLERGEVTFSLEV